MKKRTMNELRQTKEYYMEPVKRIMAQQIDEEIINKDEEIEFKTTTDTILGYDIFKYKDVYLTTEDLYA